MTKKQDERRSFSYHEAGHAVVAWSLGFRVSKVSIGMDGNDGPVTELDAVLPPRPSQALIINRGGMAAEDLFDALTSSRACVWASVPRCCNCPCRPPRTQGESGDAGGLRACAFFLTGARATPQKLRSAARADR